MSTRNNTTAPALQAFDFHQHAVRVMLRDDAPWFVAADVCRVLEMTNPTEAIRGLDSDEKMTLSNTEGHSGQRGGAQAFAVISESGLYALIFKSRKAEAKKFRKWVTSEVLPAIRQDGAYVAAQQARALREHEEARLTDLRRDLSTRVYRIAGQSEHAVEAGIFGKRMPMARVHAITRLGRLQLDAVRTLWELETGGVRARLSYDGTRVIPEAEEPEAEEEQA